MDWKMIWFILGVFVGVVMFIFVVFFCDIMNDESDVKEEVFGNDN